MNEEIIFKWDREKIESLLESVFEKLSKKNKYNCSLSKQYKNLKNLLKILLENIKFLLILIKLQYYSYLNHLQMEKKSYV